MLVLQQRTEVILFWSQREMVLLFNAHSPPPPLPALRRYRPAVSRLTILCPAFFNSNQSARDLKWAALVEGLGHGGRYSCFFADGRKQEQAKKALESALGGKKDELEKWDKEIKKREEMGGGGSSGRGGWFGGGGGWFGWFGGEHFWEEAKQAFIAVVGIVSLYLLLAKGSVLFAVVFNSLLFVLRVVRNSFTYVPSRFTGTTQAPASAPVADEAFQNRLSAKERVIRKWRTD